MSLQVRRFAHWRGICVPIARFRAAGHAVEDAVVTAELQPLLDHVAWGHHRIVRQRAGRPGESSLRREERLGVKRISKKYLTTRRQALDNSESVEPPSAQREVSLLQCTAPRSDAPRTDPSVVSARWASFPLACWVMSSLALTYSILARKARGGKKI